MKTESIFKSFPDLSKAWETITKQASICLNEAVTTSQGKTVRIAKGDFIRVENGRIVNITDELPATHIITECRGNITSSVLLADLENLETNELITLKLK